MEESKSGKTQRVVVLSPDAKEDFVSVFMYTESQWSRAQADRYIEFLHGKLQNLLSNPSIGTRIPGENNLRFIIVRWKNTKLGHRILFEETQGGIYVLRILHTSMNWKR